MGKNIQEVLVRQSDVWMVRGLFIDLNWLGLQRSWFVTEVRQLQLGQTREDVDQNLRLPRVVIETLSFFLFEVDALLLRENISCDWRTIADKSTAFAFPFGSRVITKQPRKDSSF